MSDMSDVNAMMRRKDAIIRALASALSTACESLDQISFADDLDEAVALAEVTNEEIINELTSRGIDKELIPNI